MTLKTTFSLTDMSITRLKSSYWSLSHISRQFLMPDGRDQKGAYFALLIVIYQNDVCRKMCAEKDKIII